MPFFAASEAPPRPESMKFPVFSLLAGNFGIFRDEFAADSPLLRGVSNEPVPAVALPMAFQASIFTEDLRTAFDAAERLAASAVIVNDHTAFRTDWMPFAGRRQSGYGIGGIPWTIREMTEQKMIVLRI
jgi:hypothetical protein